ncbi:ribosome-associated protein [Nocardioides perillae]|uniref:Ribosomal silencing factor RsfS n=1 Tax=Nocardioides perillae TaxID=1119534 RepID=A0A7Y9UMK1_9ACTN|nr:ribosome-associated protein [Nocardioides perillae]
MTATDHALELVQAAARAASDKLAQQIVAFDVSEQLAITDAFVLASASNDRQVKAVVDEVEDRLRDLGAKPVRREGQRDGRWVLIDYGEIVVHVQHEEERRFYALERLWRDCPTISLPEDVTGPPAQGQAVTDRGDLDDRADLDDRPDLDDPEAPAPAPPSA